MGTALELVAGRAVNPGATPTALTADTGNTFAVRAFSPATPAFLEDVWAHEATPGIIRVRSPRMHDNVQGLRLRVPLVTAVALMPDEAKQVLYPQDQLVVEITGGGAETDVAVLQVYYSDLPGTSARLALWEQVAPRILSILTNEVAVAGAATVGDWSGGTPLNTTFDLLKANVDYAVLGYEVSASVAAVALSGPDTGNLRVGGPGTTDPLETRDYFVRQSRAMGTPHIPIINAANKGATLAFQVSASASATTNVAFVLAELSGTVGA